MNLFKFDILGDTPFNFSNRFKIQKYVYFAKYFNCDLGYDFNLYVHGPYSRQLADDYFELAENGTEEILDLPEEFDDKSFYELVENKDEKWLEAATTSLSLNSHFKNANSLLERVANMKPHISKEEIYYTILDLDRDKLLNLI